MTIAAISTPNAAGGIGIIRVSGEDSIPVTEKLFTSYYGKKLSEMKGYTAAYGKVYDADGDIDDAVVIVYRAPRSYTGEDVTEICCHGGLYILQRVLRAVFAAGASAAGPGEFTKRAFLNGRIGLTEAESVMNVISAQGEASLRAARSTLEGSIAKKAARITESLLTANAGLAVWADYPDEDIPAVERGALLKTLTEALSELDRLTQNYDNGKAVTEGVKTVICGKPNVGKSTLMNALAGCRKSIVTPVAGTTRDIVEETVRLGDILLRLADTAGIHDTEDIVESIGVEMAKDAVRDSDLVLAVFDVSRPLDDEDRELLKMCREKKSVAVINKTDLGSMFTEEEIRGYADRTIQISAKDGECTEALKAALTELLGTEGLDFTSEMLANERQYDCVKRAAEAIRDAINNLNSGMTLDVINIDTDRALDSLYELTGKTAKEETVNEIFRKFCVGK